MAVLYEEKKRGRRDPEDAVYLKDLEPPEKGRRLIFDKHGDAPKGFGIRITPNGKRAFVLRYFNRDGKDCLMPIGEHPTWSLAAARKKAADYRRDIDGGQDILEQRRVERAELTVNDVVERFLRTKKDLKSYRDIGATLRNHLLPALGSKKITQVRRRDVIAAVEELAANHGRAAALLLSYTKQTFAWAEDREIIEANPVATLKPEKIGGKALSQKPRNRVLSPDEIAALWQTHEPPEGMAVATLDVLHLILLTGQRPGEVAGMRWDEIRGDTWTIPAERRGKTETTHKVPLTSEAVAILERRKVYQRRNSEYVFETRHNMPMSVAAIGKAVKRCSKDLDMEEPRWRPHDLRRTMRTGLAAAGISETVAELAVGHTRKGIAAVYDQHRYEDEKRAALQTWEQRVLRMICGKAPRHNIVNTAEAAQFRPDT